MLKTERLKNNRIAIIDNYLRKLHELYMLKPSLGEELKKSLAYKDIELKTLRRKIGLTNPSQEELRKVVNDLIGEITDATKDFLVFTTPET